MGQRVCPRFLLERLLLWNSSILTDYLIFGASPFVGVSNILARTKEKNLEPRVHHQKRFSTLRIRDLSADESEKIIRVSFSWLGAIKWFKKYFSSLPLPLSLSLALLSLRRVHTRINYRWISYLLQVSPLDLLQHASQTAGLYCNFVSKQNSCLNLSFSDFKLPVKLHQSDEIILSSSSFFSSTSRCCLTQHSLLPHQLHTSLKLIWVHEKTYLNCDSRKRISTTFSSLPTLK